MRNKIINLTANGSWQTLGPAEGFPRGTYSVTIQPRTAVDAQYRYARTTEYMTVKNGSSVEIRGQFDPGEFEVMAANGVILEIECVTYPQGVI